MLKSTKSEEEVMGTPGSVYNLTRAELAKLSAASDAGDKDASLRIALYYALYVHNPTEALSWYEVAAKQGSVKALYNLTFCLILDPRFRDLKRAETLLTELRNATEGTDDEDLRDGVENLASELEEVRKRVERR